MSSPSDAAVRAWVLLVRAHKTALSQIEAALKEAGFPPLSWYDVLLELERVGQQGMRPFELEGSLLLPQYGVSRLIRRLEMAGYLRRVDCDDDGRGQVLFITPLGVDLRRRMWSVYGQTIEDALGSKLTTIQAGKLSELLEVLSGARK